MSDSIATPPDTPEPEVVAERRLLLLVLATCFDGSFAERREAAGEMLGQYERTLRIEVAREIQRKVASLAPAGAGMRYDGTEEPGMAAWVEGLHDAHSAIQEYVEADV